MLFLPSPTTQVVVGTDINCQISKSGSQSTPVTITTATINTNVLHFE